MCAAPAPLAPVLWYAPFLSGGGYSSEAISFATSLSELTDVKIMQHGDSFQRKFVSGLSEPLREHLNTLMFHTAVDPRQAVVVCHSEPGAWSPTPQLRQMYSTSVCPPPGSAVKVGRTMFETDRLPSGWSQRLNAMDEVWVPTDFHRRVFEEGGVTPDKLVVVPEAVDVHHFDPASSGVFPLPDHREQDFVFLSVFKWEERKGWPFLLEAFAAEFGEDSDAHLYILTNAYHSATDYQEQIDALLQSLDLTAAQSRIHLLESGIPDTSMPSLYNAADCFVLPSRGEGWGRPHVEAMSMSLPVIATQWSGPSQYLTSDVGYPLRHDGMDVIEEGAFQGHQWARPSVSHLRQLMRQVYSHPEEAASKGKAARELMQRSYCPQCVAEVVAKQLARLTDRIHVHTAKDEL